MTSSLLLATLLMAGQDPEPDAIPKGPPPKLMALPGGAGTVMVRETVNVPITIAKTIEVEEGGKKGMKKGDGMKGGPGGVPPGNGPDGKSFQRPDGVAPVPQDRKK